MTDPYKILGVSPNASDEEIKAAYRELAKKFHPDSYVGNPLSDLASEKMQQINEAYDQIMGMRRGQSASQGGRAATGQTASQFADIRRLIGMGRITQAEELLDGVPSHSRDAEWFFLKGTIQHTRGWLEEAFNNISRACEMNPANPEYQAARNQLQWQRQTGQPFGKKTVYMGPGACMGCSICNICATLYCVDCCCSCLGGRFC